MFVLPPIQPRRKDVVGRDVDLKRLKERLGIRGTRALGADKVLPNPLAI